MEKTDNEIIAEFMGAEFVRKPHVFYPDKFNETYIFKGHPGNWRVEKEIKSHLTAPMLAYHTDWDWLMPVVEKIEAIKVKVYQDAVIKSTTMADFQFKRGRNNSYICLVSYFEHDGGAHKHSRSYSGRILTEDGIRINSVYKAVVEFIKWFNAHST